MGIMEKKMETTILGLYTLFVKIIGAILGIMEKQMETTMGFRV